MLHPTRVILLALCLTVAPILASSGAATPTMWDFIAYYTVDGGGVDYLMIGAIPYVMQCGPGWIEDTQIAMPAPDGKNMLRVYGSYLNAVVRFERQQNWSMDVTTFTCPSTPALQPVTVGTTASATGTALWKDLYSTDPANLAPYDEREQVPIQARSCFRIRFSPGDQTTIPFTGGFKAAISIDNIRSGEEITMWESRTWIAGTHWVFDSASDHPGADGDPRKSDAWCAARQSAAYYIVSEVTPGSLDTSAATSAPVAPLGKWRAWWQYCEGIGADWAQQRQSCIDAQRVW